MKSRYARRVVAFVSEEGARRLSGTTWSKFNIVICRTVSTAVAQLAASPGALLVLDPVVSAAARDVLTVAALNSGADVIVQTRRDAATGERLVGLLKHVVPLDAFFIDEDDSPERFARLLQTPDARSVEALVLASLAPAIRKLPIVEWSVVNRAGIAGDSKL